ncbi:MAG: SGNH/GDSL hydrolase family protein [Oscillospiraceae bacterium]
MKRFVEKIAAVCCAAAMLCGFAGCEEDSMKDSAADGNSASNTTEATTTTTAPATYTTWVPADPALNLPTLNLGYTNPDMCKRAVISQGNRARLAAVMERAESGKPVTIGVIGGSITQGSSASSSQENYAFLNTKWWAEAFPKCSGLNFVNAGIGATGSYIGVHRVAEDLLAQKPDVVVVEFSVNDTDAAFNLGTYDSLVRKILNAENNPAVILMFMCQENNTTLAETHRKIGEAYDLPMLSYQQAVMPEIEKGTFAWTDIAADNIHPNSNGHGIMGELLWNYYNSVYAQLDDIDTSDVSFTASPVTEDRYAQAELLNSKEITPTANNGFADADLMYQFPSNWQATEAGASLTFDVEARNIGIMYYRTIDGKSGKYEVYVDGQLADTLDGNFANGWGNYAEAAEVYQSDAKAKHTVEIRCKEGETACQFGVLGLLVS